MAERTFHIDLIIRSESASLLPILQKAYPGLEILDCDEDDKLIAADETAFYYANHESLETSANKLRAFRIRKGLTQKALAEATGVKREAISMLEGGKRTLGVNLAKKLAPGLGIEYKQLLSEQQHSMYDILIQKASYETNPALCIALSFSLVSSRPCRTYRLLDANRHTYYVQGWQAFVVRGPEG